MWTLNYKTCSVSWVLSPTHRMKMSDHTSGNNFVCTTSSLQTEDITDMMIQILGGKKTHWNIQWIPLCKHCHCCYFWRSCKKKNESKALDVFIHNNGELTDLLASRLFFVLFFRANVKVSLLEFFFSLDWQNWMSCSVRFYGPFRLQPNLEWPVKPV